MRFGLKQAGRPWSRALLGLIAAAALGQALLASSQARDGRPTLAALYPKDNRRRMEAGDYGRFPGAGVLFCLDANDSPVKAAASWLIGSSRLVMMNAHVLVDRDGAPVRRIESCFFQIGGRNYDFDPKSLQLGISSYARRLHITDDWALVLLRSPVDAKVSPQLVPAYSPLPTGTDPIDVTMVSPAGHANFRSATSSVESCHIVEIDPPSEDGIRRARHDCNDGFGGSGSGLFDGQGHLLAMHSASLDMNRDLPFDVDLHYGSALLIEGALLDAIREKAKP